MKLTLLISSLLVASLHAGFKIPRGVYTGEGITEARAEANEKNKPLVYLLTDSGST